MLVSIWRYYCMRKIIVNKVRCKKCDDIIESLDTHDFKYCSCASIALDGGKEYQKVLWGINATEKVADVDEYIDFSYTIYED